MKKILWIVALTAILASSAWAQKTIVSGTVHDPNGIPYSNATLTGKLIVSGTPKVGQQLIPSTVGPISLDLAARFSASIYSNATITPAGSQWQFRVCEIPGVAPPLGPGQVCFTSPPITITGNSQSITTQLNAAASSLLSFTITGTGLGTVTHFSAGTLSPLFTTSVGTPNTTPALSFSLSNAAGGTLFGRAAGTTGAPAYTSTPVLGIPASVMGTLGLAGSGSGAVTITPQATAGTPTLTLPNTSGTFAVNASSPLALDAATGALSLTLTNFALLNAANVFSLDGGVTMGANKELRLRATDNTHYAGFKSGTFTAANLIWILPLADSTGTQYLRSDGSFNLSWGTPPGTGNTTSTSLTTNVLPKANGANSIVDSSVSDNGTTVSTAEPMSAGGFTSTGACNTGTAGCLILKNGTPPASLDANTWTLFGPTTITTAYGWSLPAGENAAAGLLHFAAAASHASAMTISAVVNSDLAANAVDSAKMAVVNTRRVCDIAVGDTTGSALTDAQLGPQSRVCFIPAAATIVEMDVNADGGTPNVIVGKNHAGSISNIVSAALATASAGGIACSNTGGTTGINGATPCSSTLQNTSIAAGDYLELVSGTAGGVAKFFVAHIVYTID